MSEKRTTQSIPGVKPKGWHSRVHQDEDSHRKATRRYLAEHGWDARCRKADERDEQREGRTPKEQLRLLDERLGIGIGARKERARIQARISAEA